MGIMNWINNNKKLINMKKLIILFLISNFGFCQDIDHIKKLDTIYVSFTKKKNSEKNIYTSNYRDYRFYLKKKEKKYLLFEKPDYKNSLSENGNSFLPRIEDKAFLKKNKKNIIDINFLKKFEDEYIACELLSSFKTLYIIDLTESKKEKIVLYKVYLIYNCPVYE